jgi:hypothetical protein
MPEVYAQLGWLYLQNPYFWPILEFYESGPSTRSNVPSPSGAVRGERVEGTRSR